MEKNISFKQYAIAAVVVIIGVLLIFYLFNFLKVSREEKYSSSYLIESGIVSQKITNLNEISSVFLEAPKDYYVFIGYTNYKEEYDLERKLGKIIDNYDLNEEFYYLDITEIRDNVDIIKDLNDAFKLTNFKIENIPTILYYEDSVLKDMIKTDNKIMSYRDFEKLLERNEIKKQGE